jgi:hypothetical protein
MCSVEGCERAPVARGWCGKHYQRWRNHGDPLKVVPMSERKCTLKGQPPGPAHWNWKGDSRKWSYRSAHERVAIAKGGKADRFACACGRQADEWAYDHTDPDEKRDEKGRPYSVDPDRYHPMCRSCHRTADGRRSVA